MKENNLAIKIKQVQRLAEMSGALHPCAGRQQTLWHGNLPFILRMSENAQSKDELIASRKYLEKSLGRSVNPFLPYDERMYVEDISETHVCLLNKFSVVNNHVMVVKKEFEAQTQVLSQQDFEAAWKVLDAIEGLVYYSSSPTAGASVNHKHLHILPKESLSISGKLPVEYGISKDKSNRYFQISAWNFKHLCAHSNSREVLSDDELIEKTYGQYLELMGYLDLLDFGNESGVKGAYNLLLTRDWIMIVPRREKRSGSIPLNALSFAGILFAKTEVHHLVAKHKGPLKMFEEVTYPL